MLNSRSAAFVVAIGAHVWIIPILHARLLPRATGDDNPAGGTKGANYFFGFLITFVILLLVFAGCGIGSRRRLLLRARTSQTTTFEMSVPRLGVEQRSPPTFFESTLQRLPSSIANWEDIMPLSASFLYKHENHKRWVSQSYSITPQEQESRTSLFRLSSLRAFALRPFHRSGRAKETLLNNSPQLDERKAPQSIQLAVVIEMPSRPRRSSLKLDEKSTSSIATLPPSNIQLGVATISDLTSSIW